MPFILCAPEVCGRHHTDRLIQDGDESAYTLEVTELAVWCSLNLELNTLKTVEMIVDFRRNPLALPPLTIMNSTVTAVESFRLLGTTISQDMKWDNHRLQGEKGPAEAVLPSPAEKVQPATGAVDTAIIESVLCTSITIWFSSATKSDLRRQRRVVRTAKRIIGTILPTLQELNISRVSKRAGKITHITSSTLPLQTVTVWSTLQSSRTTRHRNSFFPQAIHLMNS